MAYTIFALRAALERLGYKKQGASPFIWEEDKTQRVPASVSSKFHDGKRRANFLNDLTEYCWIVYSKALQAAGNQLIGRQGDLWVTDKLAQVGITLSKKHTLWEPWTQGNIQVMDKWSPVVNDCWVLGGVHRRAEFELVSRQAPENLWDHTKGFHVVTARELLGLRLFGYRREERGGKVVYSCAHDPGPAINATLESYHEWMTSMAAKGPNSVTSLIVEMAPGLNKEIESFDRSRLRPVGGR